MQQPKSVDRFLQKEVSRREFIGFLGAATLGIIGVSGIIKGLRDLTNRHVEHGYGGSSYGGARMTDRR
jgi:hypothetical protein